MYHRLVRDLPKVAAQHVIEAIGLHGPNGHNLARAVLSKVIAYAIKINIRADNPFAGLEPYRLGTHHTWTDAEIDRLSVKRRWRSALRTARYAVATLLQHAAI